MNFSEIITYKGTNCAHNEGNEYKHKLWWYHWYMTSCASIHKAGGRLTARSREVSKPGDSCLDSSNDSKIWQATRQQRTETKHVNTLHESAGFSYQIHQKRVFLIWKWWGMNKMGTLQAEVSVTLAWWVTLTTGESPPFSMGGKLGVLEYNLCISKLKTPVSDGFDMKIQQIHVMCLHVLSLCISFFNCVNKIMACVGDYPQFY